MTSEARRAPSRAVLIAILGALVLLGGLALRYLGIGAELSEEKQVVLTIEVVDLREEVGDLIEVGDPVFTDPAGMRIGEVTSVEVYPSVESVPDAQGELHEAADPVRFDALVTVTATGREGDGFVALGNEVVQAGRDFNLISRAYYLLGKVVSVDVE